MLLLFFNFKLFNYPRATSNIIIIAKPAINPKVARFLFSFIDSGSSSLAATAIMAPAANANKNGNTLLTVNTNTTPITADIGSTIPDNCPHIKLLNLEKPSFLSGKDTAAPSGKF